MTGATLKSRVNELLDLVGLNKARDRRLGTYSKGMLQRIGLAQALIHDPSWWSWMNRRPALIRRARAKFAI
jgi:ABC-type multidrug transport system, ATPase component